MHMLDGSTDDDILDDILTACLADIGNNHIAAEGENLDPFTWCSSKTQSTKTYSLLKMKLCFKE